MKVTLVEYPTDKDWMEVKRRALRTIYGKELSNAQPPTFEWKKKILEARHSPIRYLRYSFQIEGIPSNTSTHLCRHVHAQPYVSSLRNDRQGAMDGNAARRDTPVDMMFDVNAEELMVIANKRLCMQAAKETRRAVEMMCEEARRLTPEIAEQLVPMCVYCGGVCHEMRPCGRQKKPFDLVDFARKSGLTITIAGDGDPALTGIAVADNSGYMSAGAFMVQQPDETPAQYIGRLQACVEGHAAELGSKKAQHLENTYASSKMAEIENFFRGV